MRKVLSKKFFNRDTRVVAEELLGKYLVRRIATPRRGSGRAREIAGMITEVEVYDGPHDKGSHASRGMTPRNKIMFGHPGLWYPYFTYGMHWLVNITAREKGYPAAILIRGVQKVSGPAPLEISPAQRAPRGPRGGGLFLTGPARVTKFFKINGKLYGKPAVRSSGLWIEDRRTKIKKSQIHKSARIGIEYAGEYWKKRRLRYILENF